MLKHTSSCMFRGTFTKYHRSLIPIIVYYTKWRGMSDIGKLNEEASAKVQTAGPDGEQNPSKKSKKEDDKHGEPDWKKYATMPLEEKRQLYKCGPDFVMLENIITWPQYVKENACSIFKNAEEINQECHKEDSLSFRQISFNRSQKDLPKIDHNPKLNEKVLLWKGDITRLEIDAIVNAANQSLLGGGGVDGCIHRAAGRSLREECSGLHGCKAGDAKITLGHKLPAKYVIHTVGPFGENKDTLRSCYERCLTLALENNIKSIAFCCISTGIYGYPNDRAAFVALKTVRNWLEDGDNADKIERIIFCLFLPDDVAIYESYMTHFFPLSDEEKEKSLGRTSDTGKASQSEEGGPDKPVEDTEEKQAQQVEGSSDSANTKDEKSGGEPKPKETEV